VNYNCNASSLTETLRSSCGDQHDYVTTNSHHNSTLYTAVVVGHRCLTSSQSSVYTEWSCLLTSGLSTWLLLVCGLGCSANKLHAVKPHLGYCSVTHLSRQEDYALVTHVLYLLSGDSQPLCDECKCSLTVKHILLDCCNLQNIREKYFKCSLLKELFESVDATTIMDFIKGASFYRVVSCYLCYHLFI